MRIYAHRGAPVERPENTMESFRRAMELGADALETDVHLSRDGQVVVNIIRAEMGQHVGTAIARIVADELEADWAKVKFLHVDTDPKWGLMVTGGSWSVWQSYPLYSQAAAAGRLARVDAGAKLRGVPASSCTARNGAVVAGGKSVSYGDIVARGDLRGGFSADELAKVPLKKAADRRLIGKAAPAQDIPTKTDGSGIYGIDAKLSLAGGTEITEQTAFIALTKAALL